MYGLFLRALQGQVCTTFSPDTWGRAIIRAGLASDRFEPLLPYDAALFRRVLSAVAAELGRGQDAILEDVGTWIITGAQHDAVRRLLRFGGTTFPDFLLSLEELADRAHLALPDISLPPLILEEAVPGEYRRQWRGCGADPCASGHVAGHGG